MQPEGYDGFDHYEPDDMMPHYDNADEDGTYKYENEDQALEHFSDAHSSERGRSDQGTPVEAQYDEVEQSTASPVSKRQ